MTDIHINAPKAIDRKINHMYCPTCNRKRRFASWLYEWYGWRSTCLRCGDTWDDGWMIHRPAIKGWRKRSVEDTKRKWRAGR